MGGRADSITGPTNNIRASCWSITINNPTANDMNVAMAPGWKITGQLEKGDEGTEHYQAMLTTPQVRFSAVKKVFPRAHIEIARNKAQLANYVHKDESRVGHVADRTGPPSLFDYQHTVARTIIGERDDAGIRELYYDECEGDIMPLVDKVVTEDIKNGMVGVEYIAINPMWISAWKKFGLAMLLREWSQTKDRQTDKTEPKDEKIDEDIDNASCKSEQEDVTSSSPHGTPPS